MGYMEKYRLWTEKVTDPALKAQLAALTEEEIKNAFYKDLEFGTAGLRGVMGAGTNCMNVVTVGRTTKGIADYMKSHNMSKACVTYDSRLNSRQFAETVACVFAANGIKCVITRECMPTPFLSFMTRNLRCDVGINITASHNPKQYNGYKVYDEKGCQITDNYAAELTEVIENTDPFSVETADFAKALESGQIVYAESSVEEAYLSAVLAEGIGRADGIKVAYTPLNGTGYRLVPAALKNKGVTEIYVASEQGKPDGNFTTCPYPNPERADALLLAQNLAEKNSADIIIGTDPDCDRLGVASREDGGIYKRFTGNEVGVLLCDYVLSSLKEAGKLPERPVVVKTIVTTALAQKIAENYGCTVQNVLTGFKYIGNVINNLEENGERDRFVFGFEESCGYLKGGYVRDKDAVVASMLVAEMTAKLKKQGKTLGQRLSEIYSEYGRYRHKTVAYEFAGADGAVRKEKLLQSLRESPLKFIAGEKVTDFCDFLTQKQYDLPKADVLRFCAGNTELIVRPSGTEPQIKVYVTAVSDDDNAVAAVIADTDKIFK